MSGVPPGTAEVVTRSYGEGPTWAGYPRPTPPALIVRAYCFACGEERITTLVDPDRCQCGAVSTVSSGRIVWTRPGLVRSHCQRGHEFTPKNTQIYVRDDGQAERRCRECRRLQKRAAKQTERGRDRKRAEKKRARARKRAAA